MISIINFGMGNIRSVKNALDFLKIKNEVITKPEEFKNIKKLILPGVGSFRKAMDNLREKKFIDPLNKIIQEKKIPVLGICLGMQLMAEESEEDGDTKGLGWVSGKVKKFPENYNNLKVPHVGFNTVIFDEDEKLFEGLNKKADFYFVHSYRIPYKESKEAIGWAKYGNKFAAIIQKDNITGMQFHPEKSQSNGLILLKNFAMKKS